MNEDEGMKEGKGGGDRNGPFFVCPFRRLFAGFFFVFCASLPLNNSVDRVPY